MRILYLANIRLPTEKAHGLQIMKTCEALAAAGQRVVLYVPDRRNAIDADPFDYYGVSRTFEVRRIACPDLMGLRPAKLGFVLTQLAFSIAASFVPMREGDVIYSRDEYTLFPLSFYKRRLFFEAHDGRWNIFMKRVARACDGILPITSGLADFYEEKGIPRSKMTVVPDAVDLSAFTIASVRATLRRELGLPPDAKIATYSGSLSVYSWKGVDVFLESLSGIQDANARYMVVGGSPRDVAALKERFKDSRIIFIGRVAADAVPGYLLASDALVLPNRSGNQISERFTSPMKMFEYMAAAKPIVASDLPSMREVLSAENSILVDPDDPKALAGGISKALNDPAHAAKIAAKAKSDAALYSWQRRAERVLGAIAPDLGTNGLHGTKKDTEFYDRESAHYSEKRYPSESTDYTHDFFKRRLDVALGAIQRALVGRHAPSILEVGCADGVVLRAIHAEYGDRIASYEGIDVSPKMIEAAKRKSQGLPLSFAVRDLKACFGEGKRDIIVEIGVLNYAGFDADIDCAAKSLPPGGLYICSVAGTGSLWDKLRKSDTGFSDFRSYEEYETKAAERFDIVGTIPVGLFIPGIWRVPAAARIIQRLAEASMALIAPGLFHENVYVLKLRS